MCHLCNETHKEGGKCGLWSRQKVSIDEDQEMDQRSELLDRDIEISDKNANRSNGKCGQHT